MFSSACTLTCLLCPGSCTPMEQHLALRAVLCRDRKPQHAMLLLKVGRAEAGALHAGCHSPCGPHTCVNNVEVQSPWGGVGNLFWQVPQFSPIPSHSDPFPVQSAALLSTPRPVLPAQSVALLSPPCPIGCSVSCSLPYLMLCCLSPSQSYVACGMYTTHIHTCDHPCRALRRALSLRAVLWAGSLQISNSCEQLLEGEKVPFSLCGLLSSEGRGKPAQSISHLLCAIKLMELLPALPPSLSPASHTHSPGVLGCNCKATMNCSSPATHHQGQEHLSTMVPLRSLLLKPGKCQVGLVPMLR